MKQNFQVVIETLHVDDRGQLDNVSVNNSKIKLIIFFSFFILHALQNAVEKT